MSYIPNTDRTVLVWEGGAAVRHASRIGTGSWSAVSTVVSGRTPAISVRTPGGDTRGGSSEWVLSRSESGVPFALQRTELTYGDEGGRISEQRGKQFSPTRGGDAAEGRGVFIRFANGYMHAVLLSASLDGVPLSFPAITDTSIVRLSQLDSAMTTLPRLGRGVLELTLRYHSRGTLPSGAVFDVHLRDALSGTLMQKLRGMRGIADSIVTLRVPIALNRPISLAVRCAGMSTARYFQLERWYVPEEQSTSPVSLPLVANSLSRVELPATFALHPNHPNPFNPSATINYDLPEPSHVSLVIYDVLGRKVAEIVNGVQEAGFKSVVWDASGVASGVYLARFTATDAHGSVKLARVMKLVLAK